MKLLFTFQSQESSSYSYQANFFMDTSGNINGFPWYGFFGDADVDYDGSTQWHDDPDGRPDTTLTYKGKYINGDVINGIVLPPRLIKAVGPKVLGCIASVEYNGVVEPAVVFDVGPKTKLGEITPALARGLHINPKYNGGVDTQDLFYKFWPGVAATLKDSNGNVCQFELKSYGA